MAAIRADGSLQPWQRAESLVLPRGFVALAEANGYPYAVGGAKGENGIKLLNTVERSKILEIGRLGPGKSSLP